MKILVAGDFSQKNRVDSIVKNKNYEVLFGSVSQIIKAVDYAIVNFEFPIIIDKSSPIEIPKNGPSLRGSLESIGALKYAGFQCCTLANNHILDQGSQCCIDTKTELESAGIDTVGVGVNLREASQNLYKIINGETIAIINCCEHEYSIAAQNTVGANPLNPISQYYQIKEARDRADFVLVIVHGGHEKYQLPSVRMQETYRFFIDAGADAVVNGHQHCFSGYEYYNSKPIVYGLGNFCFDYPSRTNESWNEGYMAELNFAKNNTTSLVLHPYTQCDKQGLGVHLMKNREAFDRRVAELNNIIKSPQQLFTHQEDYYLHKKEFGLNLFQPYYGHKVLNYLYRHHLLPSLVTRKQMLKIQNCIECESHRDVLISSLIKIINAWS